MNNNFPLLSGIFLVGAFTLLFTACAVSEKSIQVETTAYTYTVYVYDARDLKKKKTSVAYNLLHGNGKTRHDGITYVAQSLSEAGYTVPVLWEVISCID